jgi:NAD(P)H-flavin reductase
MTLSFTPSPVRIVEQYEDGEDARHYTFQLLPPVSPPPVGHGQFFLLSVPGCGEAAFTYVRAPDCDGRFAALIRKTGRLTRALFELELGALLGVRGPFGHGWPAWALGDPRVLLIAGGCGLAPLAGVLDALSARSAGEAVLVYGSRNEASQVLRRERARWAERLAVLEAFDQPTERAHLRGTPLALLDQAYARLGGSPSCALVCGPEVMMLRAAQALASSGLATDRIFLSLERRMHCGVGLCGHCYLAHSYVCTDGPTYRYDQLAALSAGSAVSGAVGDVHPTCAS